LNINQELKFTRFDYFEDGQMKTNYHISGEPVSENAYYTALEYYHDKNKNVNLKKLNDLNEQYIQALEDDYRDLDFENIEEYNDNSERYDFIKSVIQDIRDSDTEEEAIDILLDTIEYIEDTVSKQSVIATLQENANLFNQMIKNIESGVYYDDEEFEEFD